jgi:hypothetical protein
MSFSSIKVGPMPSASPAEPVGGTVLESPPVNTRAPAASPPVATAPSAVLAAPLATSEVVTRIAERPTPVRPVYTLAAVASVLWVVGLAAFAYAYQTRGGRFELDPGAAGVLALIALSPLGLIWAGAYALVQALRLAAEVRRAQRLTDEMVGPTALAAAQAGAVVDTMRGQIANATDIANQARNQLAALREALAVESGRLAEATAQTSRTTAGLVDSLSKERGELNTLALTLDARSLAVTDAINRQARMVAEASDLAESLLREAEAALAARAADLAAAAGEATDASRVAAEDLGRQVDRLETASGGVGDQMRALEDGLTQQRAALVTVAHALRAEQEDFASLTESRTAHLVEFLSGAQTDVTALNEATTVGAQALSDLIAAARGKFRELAEAAAVERDAFAQSAEGTLKGLSEAGEREREHLQGSMRSAIEALSAAAADAREAADIHAEAARSRVDQLNEAAFSAGQKADQVFEARLSEARGLIEQSAKLVEEAAAKAASKLEDQIGAARGALDGLNTLIDQVVERAARLPQETGARTEEIKAAVEQGMESLLVAARAAAQETQAIDAAFQERVKRNYEMLSEAVQLMGVVAQGGQGASILQRPSPVERAKNRIAAAHPALTASSEPPPAVEPAAAAPEAPAASTSAPRGRIKAPTAAAVAEQARATPEAAAAAASVEDAGWTWKELLTTADGEAAGDQGQLGEIMFAEIEGMGIDPNALLPKGRIDEIAATVQTGDTAGAREVVRTLAPAAIRRIARRMISDAAFRGRAQALVRRYGAEVAEAVAHDRQGFETATLLASDAGRAYLLLDGASGQPG